MEAAFSDGRLIAAIDQCIKHAEPTNDEVNNEQQGSETEPHSHEKRTRCEGHFSCSIETKSDDNDTTTEKI